MHTKNHMKSIISQASSVSKAIDEALKKAGMPGEFFVKLLEKAEGGFLGFGAKKAKIALFFKENNASQSTARHPQKNEYEQFFNNKTITAQIEEELQEAFKKPESIKNPNQNKAPQPSQNKQISKPVHQKPNQGHVNQHQKKNHTSQSTRQNRPLEPKQISHTAPLQNSIKPQPKPTTNPNSMRVRPLNIKKNDTPKSDVE